MPTNRCWSFITFLEQHGEVYITQQLALTWAQQPSGARPAEWARRLRLVRGFALHRSATDPRTEVPPCGLLPHRPQRARPYLYTQEEIRRLLNAAREMTPGAGLRPWTYYCLFGLLSVSGLRIGEARNLELQDVDLQEALLTVRGAKFGKSRLVPLHASTCKVLADYLPAVSVFCPVAKHATCSFLTEVIGWMVERSAERSMLCPGRLDCVVRPTVMGRVCMI